MAVLGLAIAVLAVPAVSAERCLGPNGDPGADPGLATLARAVSVLADGPPVARHFFDLMEQHDVRLCVRDAMPECRGFFAPERMRIVLRDDLAMPEMVLIIVHELRHLDQIERGFLPDPSLTVGETIRFTFALEADAQALTSHYAWEAEDTFPAILETLLGFPNYADIAEAYGEEIAAGGDAADASLAAFRQWYRLPWRRTHYYYSTCAAYVDRLDRTKLLPGTETLDPDRLDGLCLLPDGADYGCHETEEIGMPVRR